MKEDRLAERCKALIERGEKLLLTKRPPPANVRGDYRVDAGLFYEWKASAFSFIQTVFGVDHPHCKTFTNKVNSPLFHDTLQGQGILKAGFEELNEGFVGKLQDLVAAGVFTNFLDMATHLHESGYKDAATSLCGAVLEDGLRRIIIANSIKYKRKEDINSLNHKLADAHVYSRLIQKRINIWNDIRNNADHGKFSEYTTEDVKEMIKGVSQFLTEHL